MCRPTKTPRVALILLWGTLCAMGCESIDDPANAQLNPDIETVFLMASEGQQFISSRLVKEIGMLGGDISHFVSPRVRERTLHQFGKDQAAE